MRADYHVHSEFSDDSWYPMESVVRDAIMLGLDEICFTDHVDYGVKPDVDHPELARIEDGEPVLNVDYARYFPRIAELAEAYASRIAVRAGLEFGIQTQTEPEFQRLFDASPLDFVILSIHQVGNREFWNGDFQGGHTQREINEAYYRELLAVVNTWDDYSVVGHLDLIKRYDPFGAYPDERTRDVVAAILERVIATGHGIEVNTSSFRYGLKDLQPSTPILELYRDLGGEILTIGSDSHEPAHLAAHFDEVIDRLKALGYTRFCTFDRMVPEFHAL
ncbi:MAG: histidinol-phosphatase HisJ family protein [Atopobiaceae bacterium]|jgi:histidinol-phosphatase (PHP family)